MKKSQFILALILIASSAYGQFSMTSKKEAMQIKNAVLLVSLEEENPKTANKLTDKPDKLEHYRNQIEGRNHALKNAVEKYWSFSNKVEYTTEARAKELLKTEKGKYVQIGFGQYIDYERFKTGFGADGKPAGWGHTINSSGMKEIGMTYNRSTKYSETANMITTLTITDPDNIIKVHLPNVYPSESDAVYGIQQIQYILNYLLADDNNSIMKLPGQIKKNSSELKNKTLLLDKEDLDGKLTEKEIKEAYPFTFKIVSQEEIDKAILEKDPNVAYVQITETPGGKGNVSAHFVNNPGDGKIYCYDAPTVAVTIKGSGLVTYGQRIKKHNLEDYAKHAK